MPAPWTDPAIVERTRALMVAAGQSPIVMRREIDGFVMNRLQGALLEEAFRLVADGYASVEDVDIGLREGLALRWSFMGPFETMDLNAPAGVRDYVERYERLYAGLQATMQQRVEWAARCSRPSSASVAPGSPPPPAAAADLARPAVDGTRGAQAPRATRHRAVDLRRVLRLTRREGREMQLGRRP